MSDMSWTTYLHHGHLYYTPDLEHVTHVLIYRVTRRSALTRVHQRRSKGTSYSTIQHT